MHTKSQSHGFGDHFSNYESWPLSPQVLEEEQLGMKQELEEVHASATTAEEELSDTQVRRQKLDHN